MTSKVISFGDFKARKKATEDKKKYDEAIAKILEGAPKWPGDPV